VLLTPFKKTRKPSKGKSVNIYGSKIVQIGDKNQVNNQTSDRRSSSESDSVSSEEEQKKKR